MAIELRNDDQPYDYAGLPGESPMYTAGIRAELARASKARRAELVATFVFIGSLIAAIALIIRPV